MRIFLTITILAALTFCLQAADTNPTYINTQKLVSDNYGGVCYTRSVANALAVVHRYADGYEEIYSSPETTGAITNTIGCSPQYAHFAVNTGGVAVNRLYRQHFGTSVAEVVIDPQAATGITSMRFVTTLDINTKGGRVTATVLDSQGEVYAVELGDKTTMIADLGGFANFSGTCATTTSLFALLNVGGLSQVLELTPRGVNQVLAVSANGDGAIACTSYGIFLAFHVGTNLVVMQSNGNKAVYANIPGKLNGFAIADNGNAVVVVNNSGNQTYGLAAGVATKLPSGSLRLAALPSTVVESNGNFTIGSYLGR